MKIGIDVRCLINGKVTGVEEYTLNLLENIFRFDRENQYILFINSFREPLGDLKVFEKYPNVSLKRFRFPNKLLNLLFWYLNWPHVDKILGGLDIFFMPNISFIGLSKKVKLILTIHDLSFELVPQTFSLKRRLWHSFVNPRRLCRRADSIVAVSESTRADLLEKYGLKSSKVKRIHSGVGEGFQRMDRNSKKLIEVKDKYRLPFRFIFFLGTIEPRKNLIALVKAFDHLKQLNLPGWEKIKLVVAGGRGWKYEKSIETMKKARYTDDILFLSRISNEDKNAIYNLASVFVYPSFLEGFGFPVLEAMKCGVPTIASNTSSIPEIVGSEGILIDPEKPDEIFTALKFLLCDKKLYNHFRQRSVRRALLFSWKKAAKEYLNLFEKEI